MRRLFIIAVVVLLYLLPVNFIFAANAPNKNGSRITPTTSGSNLVRADGATKAYVTLTLKDADSNPLAGDSVSLSISNDSAAVVSPSLANLDGNGQAIFTITSTHEGVDIIDAIDNSQDVTLTGLGTVTFFSSSCYYFPPTSAPTLISATPVSNSQIKLTWKKATGTVTKYALSYGTVSGNYIYGATNIGNQDATSYTVGSLARGVAYFFVVRAVNDCAPGAFSNEVQAKAGFIISPTPMATATSKLQEELECVCPTPSQPEETSCPSLQSDYQNNLSTPKTTTYLPLIFMGIGILTLITGVIFYYKSKKRTA